MEKHIFIKIPDMSCASCSSSVEKALNNLTGVNEANVNLASLKASVKYNTELTSPEKVLNTVTKAGYTPKLLLDTVIKKQTFFVEGMTCASCVQRVEKVLSKINGVKSVVVNIATSKATVEYDTRVTGFIDMEKAVKGAGYTLKVDTQTADKIHEQTDEEKHISDAKNKMMLVWLFTIPVILWMLPGMFFGKVHGWPWPEGFDTGMLVLSALVLVWPGRETIINGFRTLLHGAPSMDTLIALGTVAAYSTGIIRVFIKMPSFAGVTAMIMAFHLTGRYIEIRARGRASQAIKKLLELGARSAIILKDEKEIEVPIEEVTVGDIMVVKPGSRIPTDGIVVFGTSSVDESMVTGESMPVKRAKNEEVIGATINQEGLLHVKASRIGKDTFLSQVVKMVEEAQGTKVPIQEFADRVTSVFVPIVIVIALVTLALWLFLPTNMKSIANIIATPINNLLPWSLSFNLSRLAQAIYSVVAVLVIACPCALGLATPTALMVGSGMGAQAGILIRDGAAIQSLQDVKTIVFDKTGTITKGKPEVNNIHTFSKFSEQEVLSLAAAAESGSEHPLARAIVESAKERKLELAKIADFKNITGKGITATINNKKVYVGSRKLMKQFAIDYSISESIMSKEENEAKTAILIAINNEIAAVISVADTIKEDSVNAIKELHEMGIDTAMLTGDNQRTAEAIARQAGIHKVFAEVLPEGKVSEVKRLQEQGHLVAMVGDGINDAPALTQANVGIAIGTGTDIAIESADVTLIKGQLSAVVSAVKLSRATFKKIRQNLFWAFFYNFLAIPLAILGLLHPAIAEIAMATSSITVVTNANLLRNANIKPKYN